MSRVTGGSLARRIAALVVAAVLVTTGAVHAWAADPQDKLNEAQQNLDRAQDDLAHSTEAFAAATRAYEQAVAQLPAAEAALASAQQALQAAQYELEVARGQVAAARAADQLAASKLAAAEQKVREQEAKIAEVSAQIDGKRASISKVATQAYQRGAGGDLATIAMVLQAKGMQELVLGVAASRSVMNAEGSILTELKTDRARLSNERVVLEDLRAEAERLRQEAAARLAETQRREQEAQAARSRAQAANDEAVRAKSSVDQLIASREGARAAAEAAKDEDARQTAAWAAERDKIQAEIAEIERKAREERARREREQRERERRESEQRERPAPERDHGGDSRGSSSGLRYPTASAYVTSPYGMRVHPITGVYKLHDGTDFRAYCGTPIRAVASGRVSWARYRGAYGNQVAVNHSGIGMVSTYSHLARFAVSPGERVSAGEVVGYSGSTGSSTACHLHFMLYVNGRLTNPMKYL